MQKLLLLIIISFVACAPQNTNEKKHKVEFEKHTLPQEAIAPNRIAIGSCSKENLDQSYWDVIAQTKPDLWIWLGDIIYGDSDDEQVMHDKYQKILHNTHYQNFIKNVPVTGIWDDHDFGLNDGGKDFEFKYKSQQLFFEFLNENSSAKQTPGIYRSFVLGKQPEQSVRLILLDTRFFKESPADPNEKHQTNNELLGAEQWEWLTKELAVNKSPLVLISSGIQVLSQEQGFETWGQYPSERTKLLNLLAKYDSTTFLILSGDRHIAEFSEVNHEGKNIVDFTSSGLTHAYTNFTGEPNKLRVGTVYFERNFGVIDLDWQNKNYTATIYSIDGEAIQHIQKPWR